MNKLFKKITVLSSWIYAEFNRDINESDYMLIEESPIEVTDTSIGGGKIVRKVNKYKMNPQVVEELNGYIEKKYSTKMISKPDTTGWSTFVSRMSSFEIETSTIIDFRGSKTEQNKTDKVRETMQKVDMEHINNVETIFPIKVSKINEQVKDIIGYENGIFSTQTVMFLSNESTYQTVFESDENIQKLTEKSEKLKNDISELTKAKKAVDFELTATKRTVAFNLLEKDKWVIKDENDVDVEIPNLVADKVKEAITFDSFKENPITLISK